MMSIETVLWAIGSGAAGLVVGYMLGHWDGSRLPRPGRRRGF